jgi:hypothetical protein
LRIVGPGILSTAVSLAPLVLTAGHKLTKSGTEKLI